MNTILNVTEKYSVRIFIQFDVMKNEYFKTRTEKQHNTKLLREINLGALLSVLFRQMLCRSYTSEHFFCYLFLVFQSLHRSVVQLPTTLSILE